MFIITRDMRETHRKRYTHALNFLQSSRHTNVNNKTHIYVYKYVSVST